MSLFLPPAGVVQNAGFAFSVLQQLGVLIPKLDIATPQTGTWRPPEWAHEAKRPLYSIVVDNPDLPGSSSPNPNDIVPLPGAPGYPQPPTVYVFDAILRAEHRREVRLTRHPVQTGATISDHAFREPAEVTLEIGMSDAMDSFTPGIWSSDHSKSVSAYKTLVALNKARNFVSLNTRLDTYNNMVVLRVEAPDTYETLHGLKATVTFREVLLASVEAVSSKPIYSALPQTTQSTKVGTVLPVPVPPAISAQHAIANASSSVLARMPKIPGAGSWSGTSISALSGLF